MRLLLWDLVFLLRIALANNSGTNLINRRNDTSIGCSSNQDLTLKLHSNLYNRSITIAEWYSTTKSLVIFTKTPENKLVVENTERGVLLRITSIDNATIGTYQCCETFNPRNCISSQISLLQLSLTEDNDDTYIPSAPCSICGQIVLGTVKGTTIECSSNVDLAFKFVSNKSNKSVTIAECYGPVTRCEILNPSLHTQYSVSTTGSKGVLGINSLNDETIGVYKCFATYDPSNYVSFEITANYTDEADNTTYPITTVTQNSTENHSDENGTNNATSSWGIPAGIYAGLIIWPVIIGCTYAWKKFKLLFRTASNASKETEQSDAGQSKPQYEKQNDAMDTCRQGEDIPLLESEKVTSKRTTIDHKQDIHVDEHPHERDSVVFVNVEPDIEEHPHKRDSVVVVNGEKDKDEHPHARDFVMQADIHNQKIDERSDEQIGNCSEPTYEQSCEDLQQKLGRHYKKDTCNIPLSNLDPSLDKYIGDIYARQTIYQKHMKTEGKHEKQVKSYKDLCYTGYNLNRHIHVQGKPGCGKSTFMVKLVHDWACGNQPSSTTVFDDLSTILNFKFIFFISLRQEQNQTDIMQMIKTQLVDYMYSEDEREDVYKLVLHVIKTEMCFVVLDDLDEWVSRHGTNLAEPSMLELPSGNCTVLTTSHSWKLADACIVNNQIDLLLEIEGISDPYTFIETVLQCLIDENDNLQERVDDLKKCIGNVNLLSISSSPRLYMIVIYAWENMYKSKGLSLCAVYTRLIESLLKKANSSAGYIYDSNPSVMKCFSSSSYLEPNIGSLDKLSEAACKMLVSNDMETRFASSEIPLWNYFSLEGFAMHKSSTCSLNTFVNKSLQYFLTAYHMARNPDIIDCVISGYLESNKDAILHVAQVFILLCGLDISAARRLLVLMDKVSVDPEFDTTAYQECILSGYGEAIVSKQIGISLLLSHVNINGDNIRDVYNIWDLIASNVQSLHVAGFKKNCYLSFKESPAAPEQEASHLVFDLSSSGKLKQVVLNGVWLEDVNRIRCIHLPLPEHE